MADHLLEVRNLSVEFHTAVGVVKAVRDMSYHLDRGETLAILGESGSGKSVSSSAIMNLIDMPPGRISSGEILLDGVDLLTMPLSQRREINGRKIAMIFQDPLSHLNPVYTVGWQIREALTTHGTDSTKAQAEALRLLGRVGIPDPEHALDKYPHEFPGGQRQRVMIAMALALRPDLLIADEPTTALDVTVQAQVLELMNRLKREFNSAVIFITHDLGVIAEMSDEVAVMYLGRVVEYTDVDTLFHNPKHPYTIALLQSIPSVTRKAKSELEVIEGTVPYPMNMKPGCGFYSRCKKRIDGKCNVADIPLVDIGGGHKVRCVLDEALRP